MIKILQWFGFDRESIPKDADVSFSFANFPDSWRVFVLLALILSVGWIVFKIYQKENESCPKGIRKLLFIIRFSVCLLLITVFLEPSVVYTQSRSLRPIVRLIRDASQSMNIKDSYAEEESARSAASVMDLSIDALRETKPSRVDVVNKVLGDGNLNFFRELSKKGRVKILDFGETSVEVGVKEKNIEYQSPNNEESDLFEIEFPKLNANGVGTDISGAIRESLEDKLTSSIVIFTDGQHNTSSDVNNAIKLAENRKVPIFFVGIGDADRPRNISISNLYADPQVWNNDPFQIQAIVGSEGIDKDNVKVNLVEIVKSEDGEEIDNIISSKNIDLNSTTGRIKIDFSHTPTTPGEKLYTVRAEVIEGESNADDNSAASPTRVNVLDDNAKVLLISGDPSWEYRALVRLLTREKMINLSCWLQSLDDGRRQQGNSQIESLPVTKEALFEYDVIIMLDPNPAEFNKDLIDLFKNFVSEHSGGFLYMPGPVYAGRFLTDSRASGIKDLLPVSLGDVGSMEVSGLLSLNNREWPLTIVAANADQPIMRFYEDPQRTLDQWKKLPGTFWSFPALEAKPATRVLIEHSDPTLRRKEISRPLLVTGQFGTGRTTYLGFDGTWRWRTKGLDAEFFKRFWVQTTRYLVEGRSLVGKRRGQIESERFQYQVGDRIRLTASLRQKNFDWLDLPNVKAVLTQPNQDVKNITFDKLPNQPGVYETTVVASNDGSYSVSIELDEEGDENVTINSNFVVVVPFKEIKDTWLDRDKLKSFSASTGGAYFSPDKISDIPTVLPDLSRRLTYDSPPMPLWDNRILFISLFILLVLEWALRKKFKLI